MSLFTEIRKLGDGQFVISLVWVCSAWGAYDISRQKSSRQWEILVPCVKERWLERAILESLHNKCLKLPRKKIEKDWVLSNNNMQGTGRRRGLIGLKGKAEYCATTEGKGKACWVWLLGTSHPFLPSVLFCWKPKEYFFWDSLATKGLDANWVTPITCPAQNLEGGSEAEATVLMLLVVFCWSCGAFLQQHFTVQLRISWVLCYCGDGSGFQIPRL